MKAPALCDSKSFKCSLYKACTHFLKNYNTPAKKHPPPLEIIETKKHPLKFLF